ncbi:MAG: hypothetical protein QXD48_03700 [Candidatus Aenigmatarchaeota archaeon]
MLPFDSITITYVASFFFIFAIIFGILNYVKVLGFSKNVNAIIAVVIAFFSIAYEPFVFSMQEYMPFVAVIFVVVFFILFLKKVFGKDEKETYDAFPMAVSLGIMLLFVGIFWQQLSGFLPYGIDPMNALWIIGILIIIVIFWTASKHKPDQQIK